MVNINLLPKEIIKGRKIQYKNFIIGIGFLVLFTVVGMWVWGLVVKKNALKNDLIEVNRKIDALQPRLLELRTLEAKIIQMKKHLDVMLELQKGRTSWVKFLDLFCNAIPERVWLQNFSNTSFGNGWHLSFSGVALDNFAIADFMINLMNLSGCSNVELDSIQSAISEETPIKNFRLTCDYIY